MSGYEPGTVAVATVRGVPNVRAVRLGSLAWASAEFVERRDLHAFADVTNVRPLVVLDLDDPRRVTADLMAAIVATGNGQVSHRLRALRNQIEAQTKPPKPGEPTARYAVVEDVTAGEWCRIDEAGDYPWQLLGQPVWQRQTYRAYDDINAVRVLSEGIS